jgi:hypothetical protein
MLFALILVMACERPPMSIAAPPFVGSSCQINDWDAAHSEEVCRDVARQTAVIDLGCPQASVISALDIKQTQRRVALRYVIEGCGQRATYIEDCTDWPRCHYLAASRFSVAPAAASSTSVAPSQ